MGLPQLIHGPPPPSVRGFHLYCVGDLTNTVSLFFCAKSFTVLSGLPFFFCSRLFFFLALAGGRPPPHPSTEPNTRDSVLSILSGLVSRHFQRRGMQQPSIGYLQPAAHHILSSTGHLAPPPSFLDGKNEKKNQYKREIEGTVCSFFSF